MRGGEGGITTPPRKPNNKAASKRLTIKLTRCKKQALGITDADTALMPRLDAQPTGVNEQFHDEAIASTSQRLHQYNENVTPLWKNC